MRTALAVLTTLVLGAAVGTASVEAKGKPKPGPTAYTLPGAAVFPEGIALGRAGTFYVSSTGDGTIFRGNVRQPQTGVFLAGGADGRTTAVGLDVDRRGLLFVAGGNTGLVWVYDTRTGALVRRFETGPGGFLNDVIVARNGDAYVTDSLRPVLWRIPASQLIAGAPSTAAEAFLSFTGTPLVYGMGFNLNGIATTPGGRYLIVAQTNTGRLFRIDLATKTVGPIDLGGQTVSADGIELRGRTLYAIARPDLVTIRLSGDLLTGRVVSRTPAASLGLAFPTTLALLGPTALVVNSQFDRRGPGLTPTLPFTVSRVRLPKGGS